MTWDRPWFLGPFYRRKKSSCRTSQGYWGPILTRLPAEKMTLYKTISCVLLYMTHYIVHGRSIITVVSLISKWNQDHFPQARCRCTSALHNRSVALDTISVHASLSACTQTLIHILLYRRCCSKFFSELVTYAFAVRSIQIKAWFLNWPVLPL